jgi:hypothetical protein
MVDDYKLFADSAIGRLLSLNMRWWEKMSQAAHRGNRHKKVHIYRSIMRTFRFQSLK